MYVIVKLWPGSHENIVVMETQPKVSFLLLSYVRRGQQCTM
jgi:hypothetical protein